MILTCKNRKRKVRVTAVQSSTRFRELLVSVAPEKRPQLVCVEISTLFVEFVSES